MSTLNRNFGLDLLRCCAVMFVLLAHTLPIISKNPLLDKTTIYGAVWGVELFFVLSGFLIGTILIKTFSKFETNLETCKQFWIRRWFRTLPNYFLMLFGYLLLCIVAHRETPNIIELIKHVFFIQRLIPISYPYTFYGISWSLCVEEWFYLIFPLLIWVFYKISKSVKRSIFLSIVFIILAPLLFRGISNAYYNWPWDEGIRKTTLFRFDAIGIGVLAAYICYYKPSFWSKKKLLLTVGIASQICLLLLFNNKFLNNYNIQTGTQLQSVGNFMNVWFFTINCLSLICFLPYVINISIENKLISTISLISYSIYLTHPLVLMINHSMHWKHPEIEFCIVYIEVFIISYLQYKFFEVKMTNLRNTFTSSKNAIVKILE